MTANDFYSQNTQLSKAAQVAKAATKLYEENDPLEELVEKGSEGQIVVSKHKTFEAAMQLHAEHPPALSCTTENRTKREALLPGIIFIVR